MNLLNYRILLETNGSISLEKVSPSVIKIMDIKCPASGEEKTFKKSNLKFLIPKQDEIKFVISDRNDYEWMKQKIREYDISHHKIIISCVFQKLEPAILAQWILEDKLPHRMQLQLQKYIWTDQKKGV